MTEACSLTCGRLLLLTGFRRGDECKHVRLSGVNTLAAVRPVI
jgi:hypothetical protein